MIQQSLVSTHPAGGQNPHREEIIHFAREALALPETIPVKLSPLEKRGSDRKFYRVIWNHTSSAILIHYNPKRVENACYAEIALFLNEIGVPAPKLFRHEPARCLIVMQDLGETDLWFLRETPWKTRRNLYQKTLSIIHKLHSFPEKEFPKERLRLMESFSLDLYRWEWNYFKEYFIRRICQIELGSSFEAKYEEELSDLAERLLETRQCLIHRDLQSQNVMIFEGMPFLIDFQGMRFGSLFYDLGSLLCDPYVQFNDNQRMDLLLYYYKLSKQDLNWEEFQEKFWEASAQRLMQALGAYGFLGLKKGLKAFLEHIPSGVHNLKFASSRAASLPMIQELATRCQKAIEQKGERF